MGYFGSASVYLRMSLHGFFADVSRNVYRDAIWFHRFARLDGPTRWCERCRVLYDGWTCPHCSRRLVMFSPLESARRARRRALQLARAV